MNKTSLIAILAILSLSTGCINCVNQSIHGNGKAVVIKADTKAVVTPTKKSSASIPVKSVSTASSEEWTLVSTTKEIVSSQPVLF